MPLSKQWKIFFTYMALGFIAVLLLTLFVEQYLVMLVFGIGFSLWFIGVMAYMPSERTVQEKLQDYIYNQPVSVILLTTLLNLGALSYIYSPGVLNNRTFFTFLVAIADILGVILWNTVLAKFFADKK